MASKNPKFSSEQLQIFYVKFLQLLTKKVQKKNLQLLSEQLQIFYQHWFILYFLENGKKLSYGFLELLEGLKEQKYKYWKV